jgi:hypothetical protein
VKECWVSNKSALFSIYHVEWKNMDIMKKIKTLFYLILGISILSCKSNSLKTGESLSFQFLNTKQCAAAILKDDSENFFEKIKALDASIQMKSALLKDSSDYLKRYRAYLFKEADSFNVNEKKFLNEVVVEACEKIKKLNPKINLSFKLAKINTRHYGENVYYTRGDVIFIPKNIFTTPNKNKEVSIMLHEIWHLLAEANPKLKDQLYALIGFTKHNVKVKYPNDIDIVRLTNPDGAHDEYSLQYPDGTRLLPLIRSKRKVFDKGTPLFFDYLQFDLYYIDKNGNVITDGKGGSTASDKHLSDYFGYIKDNTHYIIHPDEIIADNFMNLVLSNDSGDFNTFSKDGKELLYRMKNIFKMQTP